MIRKCFFTVMILFAGWMTAAAEDYKVIYGKAIAKIDQEKWSEAEQLLRDAIAANPTASDRKMMIYGNRIKPYLPYYHLGLALFQQGDCRGALDSWTASDQQGAIRKFDNEYSEMSSKRELCRQQLPTPTPTPPPIPTSTPTPIPTPTPAVDLKKLERVRDAAVREIASAEEAASEVDRRRKDASYGEALKSMADLGSRAADAGRALERARKDLRDGLRNRDIEAVERAGEFAKQAKQSYETLSQAVDARKSELVASAAEKRALENAKAQLFIEIESRLPAAEDAVKKGRQLQGGFARRVETEGSRLEQGIREARAVRQSSLSVAQLQDLSKTLADRTRSYLSAVDRQLEAQQRAAQATEVAVVATATPVAQPTPAQSKDPIDLLRKGADALLSTRYEAAVDELDGFDGGTGRAAALIYLVRSASRFALYRVRGEKEPELIEAARADVESCRTAEASIRPDPTFFSPAFITFFDGS